MLASHDARRPVVETALAIAAVEAQDNHLLGGDRLNVEAEGKGDHTACEQFGAYEIQVQEPGRHPLPVTCPGLPTFMAVFRWGGAEIAGWLERLGGEAVRPALDRFLRNCAAKRIAAKKKAANPSDQRPKVNREASRLGDEGVRESARNPVPNKCVGMRLAYACHCHAGLVKTASTHAYNAYHAAVANSATRKSRNTATRLECRISSG